MGAIVWLASYPKSGSTWLRAFLHNLLRDPQEGYDINKLDHFTVGESSYGWYKMIDDRPLSERSPGWQLAQEQLRALDEAGEDYEVWPFAEIPVDQARAEEAESKDDPSPA